MNWVSQLTQNPLVDKDLGAEDESMEGRTSKAQEKMLVVDINTVDLDLET